MNPTVQYWLNLFSTYGWVLVLLALERFWYIYKQPLLRPGIISDVLYTYQNLAIQFIVGASQPVIVEGILTGAVAIHFFPADGTGFLQNSLADKPLIANFVALIFFGETIFYTVHYVCHKVPVLWEFHRVHHSSVIVDSFSTSRFHFFERIAFTFPNLLCMAYFGISTTAIIIYFFFRAFMDRYIHSNIDGPRWTHKLMISSPHFHRWHHAVDQESWNMNFSGDFIFYDIVFGTAYDPPDKPPPSVFGEPGYSNNIIVHQFIPFVYLYKRWFTKHSPD